MKMQPDVFPVDWSDTRVIAAAEAERRLFEHYGLEYRAHFIDLEEPRIRIRVLEVGSGPPLVLVPGGSGEAIQYAGVLDKLRGRRCIILNLPGGGMSDAVDFEQVSLRDVAVNTLTAVLDNFELDSAPIAGSSMGGLWTLWMALDRPERVSSMVQLGCPALVLGSSAPLPMRMLSIPLLNRMLFPLAQADSPAKVRKTLKMAGCTDAALDAMPDVFTEALARMFSLPTYRLAWLSLMRTVLRPRGARPQVQLGAAELQRIACPALFIWGDVDPFGSLELGRRCVQLMPRASLEVVRGGHILVVDNAPSCASHIDAFLSTGEPNSHETSAALRPLAAS
jgi:pimeloyl-ACP methyl ester carboxylesterase